MGCIYIAAAFGVTLTEAVQQKHVLISAEVKPGGLVAVGGEPSPTTPLDAAPPAPALPDAIGGAPTNESQAALEGGNGAEDKSQIQEQADGHGQDVSVGFYGNWCGPSHPKGIIYSDWEWNGLKYHRRRYDNRRRLSKPGDYIRDVKVLGGEEAAGDMRGWLRVVQEIEVENGWEKRDGKWERFGDGLLHVFNPVKKTLSPETIDELDECCKGHDLCLDVPGVRGKPEAKTCHEKLSNCARAAQCDASPSKTLCNVMKTTIEHCYKANIFKGGICGDLSDEGR